MSQIEKFEGENEVYYRDTPDMDGVSRDYWRDWSDHASFRSKCIDAENQRNRWWVGKTPDLKKHQINAKPWRFSSDTEVPVIESRINSLVDSCMNALRRGSVRATPVGGDDLERAAEVSNFMRWAMDSWVKDLYGESERSFNHFFEKGLAATYVGWSGKKRRVYEIFTAEDLANESPELLEFLTDDSRESEAITALQGIFPELTEKRARKGLRELRDTGEGKFPVAREDNFPVIETKAPDSQVIFPQYTVDPERAPRMHVRCLMTAQEMEQFSKEEGWDEDWTEYIIENFRGITDVDYDSGETNGISRGQLTDTLDNTRRDAPDLYEIVRTYMRMFDREDGAEGIYEVVWCPRQSPSDNKSRINAQYGKFDLLSGYDMYPVVVTRLQRKHLRMYDTDTISDKLRGNQRQAKVTRDSFTDNMSINMDPPRMHPPGERNSSWGPGATVPIRIGMREAYGLFDVKDMSRSGMEIENFLEEEADRIVGLRPDNPIDAQRLQGYVNLAMEHVSKIAKMFWHCYQIEGDEEILYRVNGTGEPLTFRKNPEEEKLDVTIEYDIRLNDPDYVQQTVETLNTMAANDPMGDYDTSEIRRIQAYLAVPQFAQQIIKPQVAARQEVMENVADDLAKIYSGQTVGARPSGAVIALEYINQYQQQPDVALKLQTDPAFDERLSQYVQQYQFQLQQQQNAQTGRIGTEPAMLQNQTQ